MTSTSNLLKKLGKTLNATLMAFAIVGLSFGPTFAAAEDIIINEFMANPDDSSVEVTEASGEWIELVNSGIDNVDISGWEINGSEINFTSTSEIAASSYFLICRSVDVSKNGGLSNCDATSTFFSGLDNDGETITLTDDDSTPNTIDQFTYTPTEAVNGQASELVQTEASVASPIGGSQTPIGALENYETNNKGTPGAQNSQAAGTVRNERTGVIYATVQAGVNDAVSSDTILLGNEVYTENVTIDTPNITIQGDTENNSIVSGLIFINTSDVTLSGFTVKNLDSGTGIRLQNADNSSLLNMTVRDIGGSTYSGKVQAVYIQSGNNISITDIIITDVRTSNGSANGIFIGDSSSLTNNTQNLYIAGGSISNITATNGGYGILSNRVTANLTIEGVTIDGVNGLYVHAIGLENNPATGADIVNNIISNLSSPYSTFPGAEVGLFIGDSESDDVDAETITVSNNTFDSMNTGVGNATGQYLNISDNIFINVVNDVDGRVRQVNTNKTSDTVVISGETAPGENMEGWLFNRDTTTATPYEFNEDEAQIGVGSLNVLPIGNNPSDKFIGEYFYLNEVSTLDSFSYDFKIGSGGTAADANEFYMNVYMNFAASDDDKYYDCRYDIVPSSGSITDFTTLTFDPTQSYQVTTRTGVSASPSPCPNVPYDMGADATIRAFAVSLGDTSATDEGLDGYFDKVVLTSTNQVTTFDFEPADTQNPQADAGPDQSIVGSRTANLDGSASTDNRAIVSHAWEKLSGPGSVNFSSANTKETSVTVSQYGTYGFRLTVEDAAGNSDSDVVTVSFRASATDSGPVTSDPNTTDVDTLSPATTDQTQTPQNTVANNPTDTTTTENTDEDQVDEDTEVTSTDQNNPEEDDSEVAAAEDTNGFNWWWLLLLAAVLATLYYYLSRRNEEVEA